MTVRILSLVGACLFVCSTGASAAVADFESKQPFYCDFNDQVDGGLTFNHDFAACFYGPSNNADFPTPNTSNVMGIGFSNIDIATQSGDVFDLVKLDLAFGPFNHGGLTSDTTRVTGTLAAGGTLETVLTVGFGFQTYTLNWQGLSGVRFEQLAQGSEYLSFDNVTYNVAAVPEPATWAMMLGGFGLAGASMRRRSTGRAVLA